MRGQGAEQAAEGAGQQEGRVERQAHLPARELVRLYRERREIETGYAELKSTVLGGTRPAGPHPRRRRPGQ
ncbi:MULTISPECIES: hypothetical protein [Streptomyces]|uniref:hypothetical protein n=1 Tax=Streptomyces TaxID=1883 RepID=UPI001F348760|nr:hypothetical protein [Streptomyces sp. SID685]